MKALILAIVMMFTAALAPVQSAATFGGAPEKGAFICRILPSLPFCLWWSR